MPIRNLYITRRGDADAFGQLTEAGREQAGLLGKRLAHIPLDAVWHSPLPRAAASEHETTRHLQANTSVAEAPELIDHIPYVPAAAEMPSAWLPFFDGYDMEEAEAGHRIALSLTARFAGLPDPAEHEGDIHELHITHAYPVSWLLPDSAGSRHVQ